MKDLATTLVLAVLSTIIAFSALSENRMVAASQNPSAQLKQFDVWLRPIARMCCCAGFGSPQPPIGNSGRWGRNLRLQGNSGGCDRVIAGNRNAICPSGQVFTFAIAATVESQSIGFKNSEVKSVLATISGFDQE